MALVVGRALEPSRRGERSNGARLALAIEGGGMAGAVSAGMCAALEAHGLIDSFDLIYGSSAGALNASYTASGQAQQYLDLYLVGIQRRVIDPRRVLVGKPAFRSEDVFGSLLRDHPHAVDLADWAPRLRVTAACVADQRLDVLGGFASLGELRAALRASCSIPGMTGEVVEYRGGRYVDGSLLESLPFRTALRKGATHVLVLRTRPRGFRQGELRGARRLLTERLLQAAPASVVAMYHELPARYNTEARDLEAPQLAGIAGHVAQVAPPAAAPLARQLECRPQRVRAAMALGAHAVRQALPPGFVEGLRRVRTGSPDLARAA